MATVEDLISAAWWVHYQSFHSIVLVSEPSSTCSVFTEHVHHRLALALGSDLGCMVGPLSEFPQYCIGI